MHSATNLAVVLILSLAGLSVLAQEPTHSLTEAVKILQEDSSGRLVSASLCQCRTLPDPQCSQAYVTLSDSWRRVVYSSSAPGAHLTNCDKTLSPGWYRFSFPDQSNGHLARIPTSPPATEYTYQGNTCGTVVTAWMDASLPSIGHPPKDVTMKFAYEGKAVYDPSLNREAKVVACSEDGLNTFYLYHLSPTTQCNLAYCATAATTL